jgi:hypothetical protein
MITPGQVAALSVPVEKQYEALIDRNLGMRIYNFKLNCSNQVQKDALAAVVQKYRAIGWRVNSWCGEVDYQVVVEFTAIK